MSFDFENAPWGTVLTLYAAKVGLELRMDSVPPGVLNYRDSARYTPPQVLAILNVFLGPRGYRLSTEGRTLIVSPLSGPETTAARSR